MSTCRRGYARAAGRRLASAAGQALTETLLMIALFMVLITASLQLFLIDEYTFRLATKSYSRLFSTLAFPANTPTTAYEIKTDQWSDAERNVPLVPFLQPFGLRRTDLRIRSVNPQWPGGNKRVQIGRGAQASLKDGADGVDLSAVIADIESSMDDLDRANRIKDEAKAPGGKPPAGKPGGKGK